MFLEIAHLLSRTKPLLWQLICFISVQVNLHSFLEDTKWLRSIDRRRNLGFACHCHCHFSLVIPRFSIWFKFMLVLIYKHGFINLIVSRLIDHGASLQANFLIIILLITYGDLWVPLTFHFAQSRWLRSSIIYSRRVAPSRRIFQILIVMLCPIVGI